MKKILIGGLSAVFLLLALSVTPVLATGTNGSFETGTDPGSYATLTSVDTNITDWTVGSGSIDYIGTYWSASNGTRSIDLNGFVAGSISQTFSTVIGATYDVTFDLSGNPDSRPDQGDPYWSPNIKKISVSATGASPQDFTYDTSTKGNSLSDMKWEQKSYSFVATGQSTTLTFASDIPGAFGPAIDSVLVTETAPAVPTGLKFKSLDRTQDFACGTTVPLQVAIPDWDDMTGDPTFSHYEYTSFWPDGSIGLDEQVLTVSELDNSWMPPTDGAYGYAIRSVDFAGNKSDWAISAKTLGGSCQIIYNTPQAPTTGTLIVNKDTVGGDGTFSLTGTGGLNTFDITTVSGAGSKEFINLAPGNYTVTEPSVPIGWQQTDNDCINVAVTAGGTASCTVTNVKKGTQNLGEIRGAKLEDKDGDGKLNDGFNRRLSGWTIYLDINKNGVLDQGEPSAVTNKFGEYRFKSLPNGTYQVREVLQPNWVQTYPTNGFYSVAVIAGKIAKKNNFGNFKLGTISGMKFNDANGNGRKDKNETGLANWTITLTKPDHSTVPIITDQSGNYSFTDLRPGVYQVREAQQDGWFQTTKNPKDIKMRSGEVSKNNNFGNHLGPVNNDNDHNGHHYGNDNDNNGHDKFGR